MSDSNTSRETQTATTYPANSRADAAQVAQVVESQKITLWGEIMKGWEWVVFAWKMLQRLGGFREIVRTLFFVVSLLIQRMLMQWGISKKKT